MTEARHLSLPWPPSLNRIWTATRRGRKAAIILSPVARSYKAALARALPTGRVPPALTGRLLVWLTLHPPLNFGEQKWDIANREKLLFDCLTAQRVWLDDSQIDALVVLRGTPHGKGRADLTIHTLSEGATL